MLAGQVADLLVVGLDLAGAGDDVVQLVQGDLGQHPGLGGQPLAQVFLVLERGELAGAWLPVGVHLVDSVP